MGMGFLERDIYQTKREREKKKALLNSYLNEIVEIAVSEGRLEGTVIDRINDLFVLDTGGIKPTLVSLYDIKLMNPLDKKKPTL